MTRLACCVTSVRRSRHKYRSGCRTKTRRPRLGKATTKKPLTTETLRTRRKAVFSKTSICHPERRAAGRVGVNDQTLARRARASCHNCRLHNQMVDPSLPPGRQPSLGVNYISVVHAVLVYERLP